MSATHPLRVLLVDDDRLVRVAMARTLKRMPGITVEDFAIGTEAIARARAEKFHLAVLDLKMPVMSGVEVATALRDMHADLHLVFVTADPHGDLAHSARALKPLAVLAKPWRPDELRRILGPMTHPPKPA